MRPNRTNTCAINRHPGASAYALGRRFVRDYGIQGLTLFATRLSLVCPFGLHQPRLPSRVVPHLHRLVWLDQPHFRLSSMQLHRGLGLRRAFEPANHPAADRPDWYRGQAAFVRADRTSGRVSALVTVAVEYLPADLWGSFPYHLDDGIWVQAIHYQIAQGAIATISLFIPCLFMGVTFPLLCDIFRSIPRNGAPSLHSVRVEHYWCVCRRTSLPVHPDIGDRAPANFLADGRLEHTARIILRRQRRRTR